MMMKTVDIYSRSWCGFCQRAKRLLADRGIEFREHDLEQHPGALDEMNRRVPGARSVPQILIGDTHIGGYTELATLAFAGELEALLEDQAA